MSYKNDFIKFMADCGVLTFGDFTLKSGRKAPYFINTGNYKTGAQLAKLGGFYADCIMEHNIDVECLFGPAYKGIPLASCAAIALAEKYNKDVSFCFDRKEVKDHGDVGILLGGPINDGDRVMMIEDVTTSGKSINETMPIIQAQGNVTVTGLCVSVDRMERGTGEKSAIAELEEKFGIRIRAIVTMQEVIEHLYNKPYKGKIIIDDTIKAAIDEYYKQYGAK